MDWIGKKPLSRRLPPQRMIRSILAIPEEAISFRRFLLAAAPCFLSA